MSTGPATNALPAFAEQPLGAHELQHRWHRHVDLPHPECVELDLAITSAQIGDDAAPAAVWKRHPRVFVDELALVVDHQVGQWQAVFAASSKLGHGAEMRLEDEERISGRVASVRVVAQ